MLAWGIAQLAGSVALLWQPELPNPGLFCLTLPVALAAFAQPRWRWLAGLWFGAALAAYSADSVLVQRLPAALDGEVFEIAGRVVGLVERDGRRQRFLFQVESGTHGGREVALPRRIRLSLYDNLEVAPGERWRWQVKLRRPRGFANPGTFDYERWLFVNRIGATGYVRDAQSAERLEPAAGQWRTAIAARVAALVEGPAAGLLRGLATGDRRGISDAQWELLRVTGTAHLMAISGLHIGLVAGLGLFATGFLRRRLAPHAPLAWPPLAGLALATAYGALAGFTLPVQRALAGAAVLLCALACRRAVASGHAFGLALTLVLLLDPLAPLGAGFWLSFGAVAAILYLLAGRRPQRSTLHRAVRVQLGLFVLLAPLTAVVFGQVPVVSPLANAVAIPLFGFAVVPLVLAGVVLLAWPAASAKLFAAAGWLLERLLACLEWLAGLDPGVTPALPGAGAVALALVGLLAVAAPRAVPGCALAPWLLLPAAWPMIAGPSGPPPLAVHFLDVGQGSAIVVETASHTLVYDAGPRFGSSDAAAMVVVPFLETRGRRPGEIMISHGDSDHAGGLATLHGRYPDARVSGRTRRYDASDCAGRRWQWDGVHFAVLHPPVTDPHTNNNASCVLSITHGKHSVLLTGDIEAEGEARLLRDKSRQLKADVVLIPHHGSLTSSTPRFVAATGARLAIAAAGHGNQWDFPRDVVVERWRDAGAEVLSTGESGAITLVFDGDGMHVARFREQRRLWRDPPGR